MDREYKIKAETGKSEWKRNLNHGKEIWKKWKEEWLNKCEGKSEKKPEKSRTKKLWFKSMRKQGKFIK